LIFGFSLFGQTFSTGLWHFAQITAIVCSYGRQLDRPANESHMIFESAACVRLKNKSESDAEQGIEIYPERLRELLRRQEQIGGKFKTHLQIHVGLRS
jgi:hypothetical protein